MLLSRSIDFNFFPQVNGCTGYDTVGKRTSRIKSGTGFSTSLLNQCSGTGGQYVASTCTLILIKL